MKVQLRNKAGEFCTLEQFCAEEPEARMKDQLTLAGKAKYTDQAIEDCLAIKRLAEIINAFGLQHRPNTMLGGHAAIRINKDGEYFTSKNFIGDKATAMAMEADSIVGDCIKASATWSETEYIVE